MKIRHVLLIFIFTLFFLFYPGSHHYIELFSFNRELFSAQSRNISHTVVSMPYVINPSISPSMTAEGVYGVELTSFTPIFEKNIHGHFFPASTVKIITALVAVDVYQLDEVLTVHRVITEGQKMGLVVGERITLENLLYGLLVHSGNDAAYVLADNYKGGYDAFISAMNKKARDINMSDSVFKNPAGLDDFGQYTSPYDLSLAGRALLKNNALAKIVSIKSITVSDVDFKYFHQLDNVNKLLGEIPGIGGLKTGYTEEAGENLITFYKKNGHTFLIVILKSSNRFEDTKQMVSWIENNIGYIDLDQIGVDSNPHIQL